MVCACYVAVQNTRTKSAYSYFFNKCTPIWPSGRRKMSNNGAHHFLAYNHRTFDEASIEICTYLVSCDNKISHRECLISSFCIK